MKNRTINSIYKYIKTLIRTKIKIVEFELKRCETWQAELNKRKKGIDPDQSIKKRQSSAKPAKKDLSQDDEKIIKSLEKLIAKQEQLLRSLNFKRIN